MTLQQNRPAEIWKRIVAGVVDYAAMWGLLYYLVKFLVFGNVENELDFRRTGIGRGFLVMAALGLGLFPFCLRDVFRGRGLGKWILGIRVADASDTHSVPSIGRLILRNLTVWLTPVGLVAAGAHPDRMRFGDRLAGTMVVDDPPDPTGSALTRRLTKGVAIVACVLGMLIASAFALEAYLRNSEVCAAARGFIDGYAPFHEVAGEVSSDNMTLRTGQYGGTGEGDGAVLTFGPAGKKDARLQVNVVLRRQVEKSGRWEIVSGWMRYNPGREARLVRDAQVHDAALKFIGTYAPLLEVVKDLPVDQMTLVMCCVLPLEDPPQAALTYQHKASNRLTQVQALMKRTPGDKPLDGLGALSERSESKRPDWVVEDLSGIVRFEADGGKERMWSFVMSKDFHRYLTDDEVRAIFKEGKGGAEVIPELKEKDAAPKRPLDDNAPR